MMPGNECQAWKSPPRFPHLQTSGCDRFICFLSLSGLLVNKEMAKRSNPALSKPVIRKTSSETV